MTPSSQLATILQGRSDAVRAMGADQIDPTRCQSQPQLVAISGGII
jgi:hypothetical protein